MGNADDAQRIAKMLYKSRNEAGKSQEFMALELGVSKMSIINWEKGTSSPRFRQLLQWFQVLGVNVHRPLMELINPELYENSTADGHDKRMLEAALDFIETLPEQAQQGLAFILVGDHGSSPAALIQLFVAYLHLPLMNRVTISRSIAETYEMCEKRGEIICTEYVMPDLEFLGNAIFKGKNATINGEFGYNDSKVLEDK